MKLKSSATKVEAKFQELSAFIPQNTDNLHFKLEKSDSLAHSGPYNHPTSELKRLSFALEQIYAK